MNGDSVLRGKDRRVSPPECPSYILHDIESVVKLSENSTLDKTF